MDRYEIQPDIQYTDTEKLFVKFLSQVTGYPVFLGFGPESWTDGKNIILDRAEQAKSLNIACGTENFNTALSMIFKLLSHLMAHIRTGSREEHDFKFHLEIEESMNLMLGNYMKVTRNGGKGRLPSFTKKTKIKTMKNYEKIINVKSGKLKEKIIQSIKDLPITITSTEEGIIVKAEDLSWTNYLKLQKTLKQWNDCYPEIKILRRPKLKTPE